MSAGLALLTAASWAAVNPGAHGLELTGALLGKPFQDRWITAGPRASLLRASATGVDRLDAEVGGEAEVWLMNAIGPGFGADWVLPLKDDASGERNGHWRTEGILGLRMAHFQDSGALGFRLGVIYDRQTQWGVLLGFTLQWSGADEPTE